jgi:hypothetical protein
VLHLPTKYYVKRAHSQCVDVIAIRNLATIKDERLEEDVCSANSCRDKIDNHKHFEGLCLGESQCTCNIT